MHKIYRNLEEIDLDLQTLQLQRQIALEELKYTKYELKESVTPSNWVSSVLSFVKKYGVLYLAKRLFR